MSADKNDAFNNLEKNNNGKSILDDELLKAKLDSMSEAEINNLLESLRQIGIEHQKYQEAHKEEIEREMQAAKAKIAAYDFDEFYNSCYREANDLAEKNLPPSLFINKKWQSCAANINNWLEDYNKIDDFVIKELAPKLHAYIKEHGIPDFFPAHPSTCRRLTIRPDSSIPFQTNEIRMYFQYCAPYHPTMPNGNFGRYFDEDNNCVYLKARLIKPTYKPNWRNDYDEEFSRLCAEADALDKQIQNIEDELARAEDDMKSYRVKQLTDIFDFAFLNSRRKEARKDIANAKQKIQTLIPDLKKQWEDIYNSEAYDAARRRNEEAYEADCRLAAEWQRKWYEACQTKYREYYL